jgi:hypothetical protein
MLYYALFIFLAMGAKLLLALAMIYLLLPSDRRCNHCDGDTLLMQAGRSGRFLARLCGGTVSRRWCPACGWEGLARCSRARIRSPVRVAMSGPRSDDAGEFLNQRRPMEGP